MAPSNRFQKPTFILNILKLIISFVCSMLVLDDILVGDNLSKIATIYVTIMGFVMIHTIVVMSYVLETPLHRYLLVAISAVGAIMFVTSGALMIDFYRNFLFPGFTGPDRLIACASLALINAMIHVVDAVLTFTEKGATAT